MKSSVTSGCCAAALLCLSLTLPLPARANPFQSIGSGLKKAGNVLNPFKKAAPKPAAEPAPPAKPKPKPTVAKATKPAPVTKKKPTTTAATTTTTAAKKTASGAKAQPEAKPVVASTDNKPAEKATGEETAAPTAPTAPDDATTPPETAPPAAPAEIPFGTPVMGRKGLVRSPYAEDQGMVDVTDLPAGAKVKCPFTGKVFRVP